MRRKRGVTLLELIIAVTLLTVITATTTASFISIKSLRKNFLNRDETFVRGNLAVATVVERALRSGAGMGATAFTIEDGGRSVTLRRHGGTDKIWLEPSTKEVKYKEGDDTEKVILRAVENLTFTNDFRERLALELRLSDDQNIRTSIQPRNQRTPPAVLN